MIRLATFLVFLIFFQLSFHINAAYSSEKFYTVSERREQVTAAVTEMHDKIVALENQVSQGSKSFEEAQNEAKELIKTARYEKMGYFMLLDQDGVMIVHPIKPTLAGKNILKLKDMAQHLFINEIVEGLRKAPNEGLNSHYYWPMAKVTSPVMKIAYSTRTPNWNWIIMGSLSVPNTFQQTEIKNYVIKPAKKPLWREKEANESLARQHDPAHQIKQRNHLIQLLYKDLTKMASNLSDHQEIKNRLNEIIDAVEGKRRYISAIPQT